MVNSSFNLSDLNGANGFALNGIKAGDYSGSVSSAGDVNADGIDDLIIGAYGASGNGTESGQSYVVFGKSTGFSPTLNLLDLNGANGFALNGIKADDLSGNSVSSAGDVNGDGIDDLMGHTVTTPALIQGRATWYLARAQALAPNSISQTSTALTALLSTASRRVTFQAIRSAVREMSTVTASTT